MGEESDGMGKKILQRLGPLNGQKLEKRLSLMHHSHTFFMFSPFSAGQMDGKRDLAPIYNTLAMLTSVLDTVCNTWTIPPCILDTIYYHTSAVPKCLLASIYKTSAMATCIVALTYRTSALSACLAAMESAVNSNQEACWHG